MFIAWYEFNYSKQPFNKMKKVFIFIYFTSINHKHISRFDKTKHFKNKIDNIFKQILQEYMKISYSGEGWKIPYIVGRETIVGREGLKWGGLKVV